MFYAVRLNDEAAKWRGLGTDNPHLQLGNAEHGCDGDHRDKHDGSDFLDGWGHVVL
jgi:hypothetical protein